MHVVNDADKSIEVMHNVGQWMLATGLNPSKWWRPKNMNSDFLFKHAEPEELFCMLVDEKPAASMVLQETERNQSWVAVDGNNPQKALYVHWLCVHRDFAGQNLPAKLIEFARNEAKKRGFSRLRLDTSADEVKLCSLYENLDFVRVGTLKNGKHTTAFYEVLV